MTVPQQPPSEEPTGDQIRDAAGVAHGTPDKSGPVVDHQPAGDAAPKRTERPHPLTPLARGWILLVAVLIGIGREFIPNGSGQRDLPPWQFIAGGVAILVVLMFVISLLGWWFTRFVIDDEEFRLETGALFRSSKKVPFERIQTVDVTQPLVARLLGLAELKIDAGSDSLSLKFLKRQKAYGFRDFLIARATGHQTAEGTSAPSGGLLADVGTNDQVLVRLNPKWVVIAFFASVEFIFSVLVVIVSIVLLVAFQWWWVIFPLLIPSGLGLITLASRRVMNQWNYTLSRSPGRHQGDNLRVARGLTNLTSQTLPTDRIQAVRLHQSSLWRPWDLWQIDLDVLGQHAGGGDDNDKDVGSLLLPPAPPHDVAVALDAILPGFRPESVEVHPVPRQVRWLRPFTASKMRWGWNDDVVLTRTGRLGRTVSVVPHAKAQSVSIHQGPLQRRLGLASVAVHTTPGPVMLRADHLAPDDARELARGQVMRAGSARRLLRTDRDATPPPASTPAAPEPETGWADPDPDDPWSGAGTQ